MSGGGGGTQQSFTYTMYMAAILLQIHVVGGGGTRQSFTYTMYVAVILLQIHVVIVNPGTHLVNKS